MLLLFWRHHGTEIIFGGFVYALGEQPTGEAGSVGYSPAGLDALGSIVFSDSILVALKSQGYALVSSSGVETKAGITYIQGNSLPLSTISLGSTIYTPQELQKTGTASSFTVLESLQASDLFQLYKPTPKAGMLSGASTTGLPGSASTVSSQNNTTLKKAGYVV